MEDLQVINYLKALVIDGVDKARSGHPGGAMSSMDFAYILFSEYLQFDPQDPKWQGRDRFILSAGHESMLLYAMLYGLGWLEEDQLKSFRQLGSKTPGHPENHLTPGVECTTGPLGQGCAMSVGFAVGSAHLSASLKSELFTNKTWVLLGDGCMQEGITYGSASLAGHMGLNNLIWFYDKNRCQISGSIDKAYSDDTEMVYRGLGWNVINIDGHDHTAIRSAIENALKETHCPTLIIGDTTMAKGAASMEGQHGTHGAPLPKDERLQTKQDFGIPDGEDFYWPSEAKQHFQRRFLQLESRVKNWKKELEECQAKDAFANKFKQYFEEFDPQKLSRFNWDKSKTIATRVAFGKLIEAWANEVPALVGGSADLEPSNMTGAFAKLVGDFNKENPEGRNLHFGVREFPMSALCNGLALYGGLIPFDATFLSFADYSRPALRLGSLQKSRVIHEFTHDSIYLGEDGPTHQPVEHIMTLRNIPDHYVMRPADPQETEVLLAKAMSLNLPSSICLTRQGLPYLEHDFNIIKQAERGAWVVQDAKDCQLVIFATGSELSLGLEAAKGLREQGIYDRIKVVSVPCWELFWQQDENYQAEIMTDACDKRVSIEAGTTLGWERFVGRKGLCVGIDHFGASAPAPVLAVEYGFTPESVVARIKNHTW
ncbi:MAG: transketolase family protein [Oligoflexales bacterium]